MDSFNFNDLITLSRLRQHPSRPIPGLTGEMVFDGTAQEAPENEELRHQYLAIQGAPSVTSGASRAVIPAQAGLSGCGAGSSAFAEDGGRGPMDQVEGGMAEPPLPGRSRRAEAHPTVSGESQSGAEDDCRRAMEQAGDGMAWSVPGQSIPFGSKFL